MRAQFGGSVEAQSNTQAESRRLLIQLTMPHSVSRVFVLVGNLLVALVGCDALTFPSPGCVQLLSLSAASLSWSFFLGFCSKTKLPKSHYVDNVLMGRAGFLLLIISWVVVVVVVDVVSLHGDNVGNCCF